ncbi:MAG: hypothetical protein IIC76_15090 [Bacteroidetes bacterium]|nr:hypothetical protein [Bacteroidota bacterium]
MNKTIKIIDRKDEEILDINFWRSKTAEEKLSAIQFLREQFIQVMNKEKEYNESRKRLRRVYRVIEQK